MDMDTRVESAEIYQEDLIAQIWKTVASQEVKIAHYIPGNSIISKLRRHLLKIRLINENDPFTKLVFKSTAAVTIESERHIRGHFYMIHPFSKFKRCWDFFILIIVFFMMFITPVSALSNLFEEYSGSVAWMLFLLTLDLCLCADIVVHFMSGYYEIQTGTVYLNYKFIKRVYLRSFFIIDFVSGFPLHFVITMIYTNIEFDNKTMIKLSVFVLLMFTSMRVYQLYTKLNPTLQALVNLSESRISLIFWVVSILIIIHWLTTFSYFIPHFIQGGMYTDEPDSRSWIVREDLMHKPFVHWYSHSLIRTLSFMVSINVNSLFAGTVEDIILGIISICIGCLCFALSMGKVWQIILLDASHRKYEDLYMQLQAYNKHNEIKRDLGSRMTESLDFTYQQNFYSQERILQAVSPILKQEILLQVHKMLWNNVNIFYDLPNKIKLSLITMLKKEIYLKNDIVIKAGDVGNNMYFISTGTVAIYNSSGLEVWHLENGDHFGELALIMGNERYKVTAVAVESSEIFSLRRDYLQNIMGIVPEISKKMMVMARQRAQKLQAFENNTNY